MSFDPLDGAAKVALDLARKEGATAERKRLIGLMRDRGMRHAVTTYKDGAARAVALFAFAQELDGNPLD